MSEPGGGEAERGATTAEGPEVRGPIGREERA
jgi:hypothetical protein